MKRPELKTPRRAASSVEFAVVSLAFFTLLLGMIELGRGLMVDYLLRNAARQACRVGVPSGRTTSDIQTQLNSSLAKSGLPQTTAVVKVNGTVADASTAQSGDRISVDVTLSLGQISWLPGSRYLSANLGGTYALRRE